MVYLNKYFLICSLVVTSLFFKSCAKDDGSALNYDNVSSFAVIAAFNGVEGTDNLYLKVDGKVINKDSEIFKVGGYLNHRTVFPGKRTIELMSPNGSRGYFKEDKDFSGSKFYTYFFFGKDKVESFVTEDDIYKPAPGLMKIRVVNLVSDSKIDASHDYQSKPSQINLQSRTNGFQEYASKEKFTFKVISADKKYEAIEIPFSGEDQEIYNIVIYPEIGTETGRRQLSYKIIQINNN